MKHLLLAMVLATGCTDTEIEEEDVGVTTLSLSVSHWSPQASAGQYAFYGGQVASLAGVTYLVHGGDYCTSGDCGYKEIWWSQRTATTGWTNDQRIPNQSTSHRVNLAAFNGFVYMVHTGRDNATALWISRFNPATQQWSANSQLALTSKNGPPALATFNGRLHLVGVNPADNKLWHATMTTGEVVSSPVALANQYSSSQPAVAVFNNRLYVAHRAAQETRVVYNSYDGTSWGVDQTIWAGTNGTALQAYQVSLATYDNYLHLVHRRPGSDYVWWTYFNGSSWALEQTIGTRFSNAAPTIGNGAGGLMLVTTDYYDEVFTSTYISPAAPGPGPGPCCIGL